MNDCLPEDVQSRIITAQVDNIIPSEDAYLPSFHGGTGELIHKTPTPYYLRLRRKEFARVLGDGLDIQVGGPLSTFIVVLYSYCLVPRYLIAKSKGHADQFIPLAKYGKRLVSIDETSGPGVTATFTDGTQHTASLLVGAEGAHSRTREHLMGAEKGRLLYSPFVLSTAISKLPAERALEFFKLHPRVCIVFHPNGTFQWIGGKDSLEICLWFHPQLWLTHCSSQRIWEERYCGLRVRFPDRLEANGPRWFSEQQSHHLRYETALGGFRRALPQHHLRHRRGC